MKLRRDHTCTVNNELVYREVRRAIKGFQWDSIWRSICQTEIHIWLDPFGALPNTVLNNIVLN